MNINKLFIMFSITTLIYAGLVHTSIAAQSSTDLTRNTRTQCIKTAFPDDNKNNWTYVSIPPRYPVTTYKCPNNTMPVAMFRGFISTGTATQGWISDSIPGFPYTSFGFNPLVYANSYPNYRLYCAPIVYRWSC